MKLSFSTEARPPMPRRSAAYRWGPTHELSHRLVRPDMADFEGSEHPAHRKLNVLMAFLVTKDGDGCTGGWGLKGRSEDYRNRLEPCRMFPRPRYTNKRGKNVAARLQESPMKIDSVNEGLSLRRGFWCSVRSCDRNLAAKDSWPGLCAEVDLPLREFRDAQGLGRARVSDGTHLTAVPKDAVMGFRFDCNHDTASLVLALCEAKYVIDSHRDEIESDLAAIAMGSPSWAAKASTRSCAFDEQLDSAIVRRASEREAADAGHRAQVRVEFKKDFISYKILQRFSTSPTFTCHVKEVPAGTGWLTDWNGLDRTE
ncbi:hypothetical protein FOZ63_006018 [Perkinsus olseni]|uniref:Uncharacterized protein n=1 Tax=Perkinsus olseni TaxID=32597 RepID=A0A7J6PT79_PEROL|nr:hypothetical protein FOZ63_006018 [Perkinsus olseni]